MRRTPPKRASERETIASIVLTIILVLAMLAATGHTLWGIPPV